MTNNLSPSRDAIAQFLTIWGLPIALSSKHPGAPAFTTKFFATMERAVDWAGAKNAAGENVYFEINPRIMPQDKKAKKSDIARLAWLHVDIDPRAGEDLTAERERILARLTTNLPQDIVKPTLIIDSGGGFWGMWRLSEPLAVDGDPQKIEQAETYNRALEQAFSADKVHNIDRVARLPGTVNWPDEKKRKKGREQALSSIVLFERGLSYKLEQFPRRADPNTASGEQLAKQVALSDSLVELDPWHITPEVKHWIRTGKDQHDPNRWPSRSEAVFAVSCNLVKHHVPEDVVISILLEPGYSISESILEASKPHEYAQRQYLRAQRAVASSGTVLNPGTPFASAQEFTMQCASTLRHHNADWYEFDGTIYRVIDGADIRQRIYLFLDSAIQYIKDQPKPFSPNTRKVNEVVDSLKALTQLSGAKCIIPCWLGESGPSPREVIVLPNGILHLASGKLYPTTERFLTVNAIETEYQPDSAEPEAWLKFLNSVWPDDQQSIDLLQEVFGYLLLPDTSQQKMFVIQGPTRSGKGTIGRILTKLIGTRNVTSPTAGSLGGEFGLENLIGKQLAIISDMKIDKKTNVGVLKENLLRITGEDMVSINRKHRPVTDWRLPTRFLFLSNSLPRFGDNSGAVPNRFVPLVMTKSFLDREDRGLEDRLSQELPGVLNWAIEGWQRLHDRGRFGLPEASQAVVTEMVSAGAPIKSFIDEECDLGGGVFGPEDPFI